MARLRCEVLAREGARATLVRDETGRLLRLFAAAPPDGARWLGALDGEPAWGVPVEEVPADAVGDPLAVAWIESQALDEVGVAVGPDRDAIGLFDAPTTGTATGEHTEGPPSGPDRGGEQRRTAVLAWIAAQPPPDAAPAAEGVPCTALKRLIADEPLDPLPALDGVPPRGREPARRAGRDPAELAPEREDTATQIEGFEAMLERRGDPDTSEEVPRRAGGSNGARRGDPETSDPDGRRLDVVRPRTIPGARDATPPLPRDPTATEEAGAGAARAAGGAAAWDAATRAQEAPARPEPAAPRWSATRVLLVVAIAALAIAGILAAVG